jgi:hypothetical protein
MGGAATPTGQGEAIYVIDIGVLALTRVRPNG